MNKNSFKNFLENSKNDCFEFEKKYQGPGFKKQIARIFKYKFSYISYVLAKFGILRKNQFLSKFGLVNMGIREIKTALFLVDNLKEGDVFYDIGANQGFFTVLVDKCFDKIEIHSFEPIPQTFNILKNISFKKSNKIFLNNLALSNYKGEIEFNISAKPFLSGSTTIIDDFADKFLKSYTKIKAQTTTLDDYIKTHNPPTLIKMDVEGSEGLIIDGGKELFSNFSPIIAMEICTGDLGLNYSLKAALKLVDMGYKIFYIDDKTNDLCEIYNSRAKAIY